MLGECVIMLVLYYIDLVIVDDLYLDDFKIIMLLYIFFEM